MTNKSADKILCVDDEENILHLFHRTLGRQYTLYTANCGESALNLLREHPDIAVIMSDYNMPNINGVEFLKMARELSSDSVQIMLTGNIELDVAIKAINETNVFRYLPKPCPIETVRKVITAALAQHHLIIDRQQLARQLALKNQELAVSNARLANKKQQLEYELEMAKVVYGKVYAYGHSQPDGLDYCINAKETVGGDFLLTHIGDDRQTFYLMMGDLTGHGLQSALAAVLVTEIFDVLCTANPGVEQLAQNINDKMHRKLPTGLFCAAILVKLDLTTGQMHVWQGGLPDAYLLDKQGRVLKALRSNNLPLGVQAGQYFAGTASCHAIGDAASLFIYSDGVTEQLGVDQSMFGSERLQAALRETPPDCPRINRVMANLTAHRQQQPQGDDISLVELNLPRITKALEHA